MKCYICEKMPGPGGTHYHIRDAIGICHDCGVAVCTEHSFKSAEPGSPFLCPECSTIRMNKQVVSTPAVEPAL